MAKQSSSALVVTAGQQRGFRANFVEYIRAGYQALYISTAEENRVELEIVQGAEKDMSTPQAKTFVCAWDMFDGLTPLGEGSKNDQLKALAGKLRGPDELLRQLSDPSVAQKLPKRCIFILRDFDDAFNTNAMIRRGLRSLCEGNRLVTGEICHTIVIISPASDIHQKLRASLTTVDFVLPDEATLDNIFGFVQSGITSKDNDKRNCSQELREKVVSALLGLTSTEAENTLALCIVRHDGFCEEMLATIKNEKANIIKKNEVLTYLEESKAANRNEIGGFENVLEFVHRRSLAYSRDARNHKLDYPKGIVLLGLPGTGKSMVAQALGKQLGLPVYNMDVGAVFGSLVGESESRMRGAIKQISAQQGCVLLIDEADKAWGGAHQSSGDSGVTQRVFGQLLTWLASKQDRTFVVMTMNRLKNVPTEFLRMGRFDKIFYTDLPKKHERRQIAEIHLRKRGVDPVGVMTEAEWDDIVGTRCDNYVGSEIEELVKEARCLAYLRHCERKAAGESVDEAHAARPNYEDFCTAAAAIVPLSSMQAEEMKAMADFCKSAATPASREIVQNAGTGRRARSVQTG